MIKCYSVRLKNLIPISEKAYKAVCFDGSSDIIPKSQVMGSDDSVIKSDAYWISEWILEKKNLQYSISKVGYFDFDPELEINLPKRVYDNITKYVPKKEFKKTESIKELER